MAGNEFDKEKVNKYYSNKYTEEDEEYVTDLFGDKEKEDKLKSLLYRQFYELMSDGNIPKEKSLDNILYRIHYNINTTASGSKRSSSVDQIFKWIGRIAVIFFFPVLLYIVIHLSNASKIEKLAWVEIKAPAWTRAQFSLPDGTTGWLNSNSSIKYSGNFINNRQILLKGEALFDVVKDQKRPFKVITDEVCITALGTRFNIASYENENSIEVVLEEGKLLFDDLEANKSRTMNPNDLVIYDKSQKRISYEVVQPNKYLSWAEGKLVFRNDPLDVIARRLERWYNVDVDVNGAFSDDLRLRATFKDESLKEVLSLLQRSLNVKCIIENRYFNMDGTFTKTKVIITTKNK